MNQEQGPEESQPEADTSETDLLVGFTIEEIKSVLDQVTDDILRYLPLQRRHSLESSLKIWVTSGISERWSNLEILKPASVLGEFIFTEAE